MIRVVNQTVMVTGIAMVQAHLMVLRLSPPEDQAGVIHAISPIWMKLGQIKGLIQKH